MTYTEMEHPEFGNLFKYSQCIIISWFKLVKESVAGSSLVQSLAVGGIVWDKNGARFALSLSAHMRFGALVAKLD